MLFLKIFCKNKKWSNREGWKQSRKFKTTRIAKYLNEYLNWQDVQLRDTAEWLMHRCVPLLREKHECNRMHVYNNQNIFQSESLNTRAWPVWTAYNYDLIKVKQESSLSLTTLWDVYCAFTLTVASVLL